MDDDGTWTLDTLRVHLVTLMDEKFRALEVALLSQKEQVSQALAAADKAVLKAETAAEKRFEGVNEFRNTLADQQRLLLPREEYRVARDALIARVQLIEQSLLRVEGRKSGFSEGWGWAIAMIALISSMIAIVMAMKR